MSGYTVGLDLGTTYTAVAVYRDGVARTISLAQNAIAAPSVLFFRQDGPILAGVNAAQRGRAEPQGMVRAFKRRIGDPTPFVVAGSPYSAQSLSARLAAWTLEQVIEREGSEPDRVAFTHPANWGPYKLEVFDQIIRESGATSSIAVTEPVAAAMHYASVDRVGEDEIVAVYDLGGGTFDATLLARTPHGFEILGQPEGIDVGGLDFDTAVFDFALDSLDLDSSVADDPEMRAGLEQLRVDCVAAKEALSADTDAVIPVHLPGSHEAIRITRAEFEARVQPRLDETIAAMTRAMRSAKIEASQVSRVLLVGGTSRIPLVGRTISEQLGRPVALDVDPKAVVALGAARMAFDSGTDGSVTLAGSDDAPTPSTTVAPPAEPRAASPTDVAAAPRSDPSRAAGTGGAAARKKQLVAAGIVVALLAVAAAFLASRGGDESGSDVPVATSVPDAAQESDAAEPTSVPVSGTDPAGDATEVPVEDEPPQATTEVPEPEPDQAGTAPQIVGQDGTVFDGSLARASFIGIPQGDLGHTSGSSSPGPLGAPQIRWATSDPLASRPVLIDGAIIAGFQDSTLRALNATTGVEIWSVATDFRPNLVWVTESAIITTNFESYLVYDLASGDLAGEIERPEGIEGQAGPATLVTGVFVGSWQVASAATNTQTVTVAAIDLNLGSLLWTRVSAGTGFLQPIPYSDALVLLSHADMIEARDALSGETAWTYDVEQNQPLAISIDDGTVVFRDGRLKALDLATGVEVWTSGISSSTVYGVYDAQVVSAGTELEVVDLKTGATRSAGRASEGLFGRGISAIGGDVGYALLSEGNVVAIDLTTVSQLWTTDLSETEFQPSDPMLVGGGFVYMVESDGQLVAAS